MTARTSTLIALLLGALATPALAKPVGTNEVDISAGSGDSTHVFSSTTQNHFTSGVYVLSSSGGTSAATSSISAVNSPIPSLDSIATVTVGLPATLGGANAFVSGFTNYGFDVGGSGDTLLHMIASGSVGASAFETAGSGQAHLIYTVREANNGPVLYDQAFFFNVSPQGCSDGATNQFSACTLGFNVNGDFLVHGGTTYEVHMEVASSVTAGSNFGSGTDTLFAKIDPQFSVQGPFSLTFSDGFGGGPAPAVGVPEPATWALMLLGFAGVGAHLRRGRRALA